jgi:hypothetical protein
MGGFKEWMDVRGEYMPMKLMSRWQFIRNDTTDTLDNLEVPVMSPK